ncbi:1,6-anhydro-N-acetylmuramyl-L-alanine amidase AmpD [bacterium]|nr:MAG: 1,6-anhydro-N-acetylmuramyl-L-alanine amidase AmpD [bacterium]
MRVKWAKWTPSPNFSAREGANVECVVIHHISLPPGKFGGGFVCDFFLNNLQPDAHPFFEKIKDLKVSAHFFITRRGKAYQFVDTDCAAWHAGKSEWLGRAEVNKFSVGVELEGDMSSGYTESQYKTLGKLFKELKKAHPAINSSSLTGHEHISPGRKTDPGPLFDWERARKLL